MKNLSFNIYILWYLILIEIICFYLFENKKLPSTHFENEYNNNHCKKIFVIFGTRPEAIKLAPVIKELEKRSYNVRVISTGQHSSMLFQTLKVFKIDIWKNLNVMKDNQSLSKLTSVLISELDETLLHEKPNLIIVQGDTTSAYIGALEAFYHHVKLAHIEAGLRTYNLNSPFPEEFNRQSIGLLADYHFAATEWSKKNLINEGKNSKQIFVTGNTVVDSLLEVLNTTYPSSTLNQIIKSVSNKIENDPYPILLTTHRRENQSGNMENIFSAIVFLLKKFQQVVIIFPMHKNPNIREALKKVISEEVLNLRESGKHISGENDFMNRLFITEPLDYIDMVHLMKWVKIIVTDSGGLQEEGVSLGKPVFILRDTTERPEAIWAGSARLIGTNKNDIITNISNIILDKLEYQNMALAHNVYGFGNASQKIVDILEKSEFVGYEKHSYHKKCFDIIITLTVWKRDTLERQFESIYDQRLIREKKTIILIFQNGNHKNISIIFSKWKSIFQKIDVSLKFIHSNIETGYFGRFLTPLVVESCVDSIFFINDDDVIFGSNYYSNMERVIQNGHFATRNCRFLDETSLKVIFPKHSSRSPVTFESDLKCDFGGHIWAGKISWLKTVWSYPPIDISNCEDIWISAVLKTKLGIETFSPYCPIPTEINNNFHAELCACNVQESLHHVSAITGSNITIDKKRTSILAKNVIFYNLSLVKQESIKDFLRYSKNGYEGGYLIHDNDAKVFELSDRMQKCYSWN